MADDLLHGIKSTATAAPRTATRPRSTSRPTRRRTDQTSGSKTFAQRAAFGPPFLLEWFAGPERPPSRRPAAAFAAAGWVFVAPVDSGKVHGRDGRRSEHAAGQETSRAGSAAFGCRLPEPRRSPCCWAISGGFVGFAIFNDNPLGGEPVARIAIRPLAAPAGEKMAAAPAAGSRAGRQIRAQAARRPGRAEDRHHHRRLERGAPRLRAVGRCRGTRPPPRRRLRRA